MKRWWAIVALAAALASCTGDSPTRAVAAAPGGPLPDIGAAGEDLPPEVLLELPPATRALELAQQAAKTTPFCLMLTQLDELDEPRPDRERDVLRYAERSYNTLFSLDPRSRVSDPDAATGRPGRVPLPTRIITAVGTQRTAMHAFLVRVRYAIQRHDEGAIDEAAMRARLNDAFIRLAASEYTEADATVAEFRLKACVGGA